MDEPMIECRGLIPILFSTTTNTSKKAAFKLQEKLQENGFFASVTCIGDMPESWFLEHEGPVIFTLATYGDGDSPADGERFSKWFLTPKPQAQLYSKLKYSILAFGNSNFEKHCGFSRNVNAVLEQQGAEALLQLRICDAKEQSTGVEARFEPWANQLVDILKAKYPLIKIPASLLSGGSKTVLHLGKDQSAKNWLRLKEQQLSNVSQEFRNYIEAAQAQVVSIKEMRGDTSDGRSTLHVVLQLPEFTQLQPGCLIDIYPLQQVKDCPEATIECLPAKGQKCSFPLMPLRDLEALIDKSQYCSPAHIKCAQLYSRASKKSIEFYHQYIKNEPKDKIKVGRMLEEMQVSHQVYHILGINRPRSYSLSSWDPTLRRAELCISLVPGGLTSGYLKTLPKVVKFRANPSSFMVPDIPLILIANGTGIAPFRSIVEFIIQHKLPPPALYYGIQNRDVDFYFSADWLKWEQQGKIVLRLAESRRDPNNKAYVQNVLEKDIQALHEHLYAKKGKIFICGGKDMGKAVSAVLLKAVQIEHKMPYKAYSELAQFTKNRMIVEEIFG